MTQAQAKVQPQHTTAPQEPATTKWTKSAATIAACGIAAVAIVGGLFWMAQFYAECGTVHFNCMRP